MTKPKPSTPAFVLIAIAGALLLFATAIGLGLLADADPGSFPDWVAAVATLAAFCAAVVAGKLAHDALKIEQGRDRDRQEEARKAQASLVAAWVDGEPSVLDDGSGDLLRYKVVIRNHSQLPVTSVCIRLVHERVGAERATHTYVGTSIDINTLPPGDLNNRYISVRPVELSRASSIRDDEIEDASERLEVGFRDATGALWRRTPRGRLLQVDYPSIYDALP